MKEEKMKKPQCKTCPAADLYEYCLTVTPDNQETSLEKVSGWVLMGHGHFEGNCRNQASSKFDEGIRDDDFCTLHPDWNKYLRSLKPKKVKKVTKKKTVAKKKRKR